MTIMGNLFPGDRSHQANKIVPGRKVHLEWEEYQGLPLIWSRGHLRFNQFTQKNFNELIDLAPSSNPNHRRFTRVRLSGNHFKSNCHRFVFEMSMTGIVGLEFFAAATPDGAVEQFTESRRLWSQALFRAITKPDGQLPTKVDKNLHFK
jgi:hypothetical protein